MEVVRVQKRGQILSSGTLSREDPIPDALLPQFPYESARVMRGIGLLILGLEKGLNITNSL